MTLPHPLGSPPAGARRRYLTRRNPTRRNPMLRGSGMRRGIAAVEFAVVLPPMILILLVSLEITRGFAVQHALQEAAMNGCRIYTLGDKTQADAQAMIDRSLDEAKISGYTIRYEPAAKADIVADLQPVTVTVTVPYSQVGVGIQWFLAGSDITAAVTLPVDSPPPSNEQDDDDDDDDDDD